MTRQRNLHKQFKSASDISFNPIGVRMYQQDDIAAIFHTALNETAVLFTDGSVVYSVWADGNE